MSSVRLVVDQQQRQTLLFKLGDAVRSMEQAPWTGASGTSLLRLDFLPPFRGHLEFAPTFVKFDDPLSGLRHQVEPVGRNG
jgi:hypothetical protein